MPYSKLMNRINARSPWRLPILANMLGMSRDEHVDVLKDHIAVAGLAPRDRKLDLVVVEDLAHYAELLEGGVPMARIADSAPEPPDPRYIRVRRRWWAAAWVLAFFMPSIWLWPYLAERGLRWLF
jgi:hypothetical protein